MRRKNSIDLPTKEELEELLEYDQDTGILIWKPRVTSMFNETDGRSKEHACNQWNSRFAGKEALTKRTDGYKMGKVGYKQVAAHRVIWKMMTGYDPMIIDHINGVRDDNRWQNLRNGTDSQNLKNARKRNSNRPYTGVMQSKNGNWIAMIQVGTFATLEEAITARKAAEVLLGYHPNHGREAA
jgi:HNH endonuclease